MRNREAQQGGQVDRRRFLTTLAAGAAVGSALDRDGRASPTDSSKPASTGKSWKLDVTIYDRPGWTSTCFGLPVMKRKSGDLVVGFQAQREDAMTDDFYTAHAEWVFLTSSNSGRSWERASFDDMPLDPRWPHRSAHCTHGWPVELDNGTLINVVEVTPTPEEHKERLERLGIGHLWFPDSTFGWDLWPASHAERLKAEGVYVFDKPGVWLPDGVVATHNRQPAVTISRDGGSTWEERRIEGLPTFSRYGAWFRGGIVLRNGTVLGAVYGTIRTDARFGRSGHASSYAVRSTDEGRNWEISTIGHDATEKVIYNETNLLELPSGRVLALVRGRGGRLFQSHSDDSGKTWTPPKMTRIGGSPANLLRLRSGKILCVYRNRGYPSGYRGVLSHDDGETWDVDREIVICDDTLPGLVGYPSSVELDDGTIFTLYNVMRVGALKPDDEWSYKTNLVIRPPLHSYIAGSSYTENYTRPLGT